MPRVPDRGEPRRGRVRACVLVSAVAVGSAGWARADCPGGQAPTTSGEAISCTQPRTNTDVWRITRPNVRQRETVYPGIQFQQGDLVSVFAGGCAQAGGTGLTWKRYINPMSPNREADGQYFGLIKLPGFGTGLRHIRDAVLAAGIPVLVDPGQDGALRLGYADDGYEDNGYDGREEGWWQQCNDLPDAWVVIAIQHGCATSSAADCVRGRALDLVSDVRDENGFPVNPDWVWTRLTGTGPDVTDVCSWSNKIGGFPVDDASLCVSELTERDHNGVCVQGGTAGGIAGHMNWVGSPVTYRGWIWWDAHDYWWDDDYTLNVASLDEAGNASGALFVARQRSPQIEFDSSETIDRFDSVPWWRDLRRAVDLEDEDKHFANALPAGAARPPDFFPPGTEAIVIGQLGVDCAHSCGTELHPAWAVFVHAKDNLFDDVWAFYVRNWGDEGFCSTNDHRPGSRQKFTIRLPRPGATTVRLKADTVVGTTHAVPPYTVAMVPGGGAALVTVTLPPPDQHGVVYGELHLSWGGPARDRVLSSVALEKARALRAAERAVDWKPGAEDALNQRLVKMSRRDRESYRPRRPGVPTESRRLTGRVVRLPPAPTASKERNAAVPVAPTDESQARRARALRLFPAEKGEPPR